MSNRTKRLELNWIGKEERPRLEPRILIEDAELSFAKRATSEDIFDNRLIHGDNLLALKALEQQFAGQVKCIYIDPPYNTGSAFEHYDDGLEHSVWLSLMRDRLVMLRELLRDDGVIFVQIDDRECAYLQVLMDEVFGRPQRINTVTVKMSELSGVKMSHVEQRLPKLKEHILIYGKTSQSKLNPIRVQKSGEALEKYLRYYSSIIENPTEPVEQWRIASVVEVMKRSGTPTDDASIRAFKLQNADRVVYRTNNKSLDGLAFPTRTARVTSATGIEYVWWEGKQMLFLSDYVEEYIGDLWTDISTINLNKEGGVPFPNGKKPEALVRRVLQLATSPGDLVLDSFAGSGTTAAVSHKMRRRWIAIELGTQATTHVVPRLSSVASGTDGSGVSEIESWKGGGGFRFFRLAPSLLEKDKWGNWVVSKEYRPEMLAEAMCKLEGFRYAPDHGVFWNHGYSTERDFIYVTTQNLSREQLEFISEQVGTERSLLICCAAFRAKNDFPNLTVKKIPQAVLSRCEWGRDDYSLNISEQPAVVAVEEANPSRVSADPNTLIKKFDVR